MNAKRTSLENSFTASDGKEIFYRRWPAENADKSKCLILLHRGHEHSARLQHIVDELDMPQTDMFSFDARGHGRTEGPRGYSPSVARSVKDVDDFVKYVSSRYGYPAENIFIIAQSISAVYAAAWVHDYAPNIRGMILASPALSIKLYVPFACAGMALWQKVLGRHFYISSYVNANFLTHDEERRKSYNEDPLITKAIASHMLLQLAQLGRRLTADARSIHTPVQLFISGSDVVVHHKPQHVFYQNLGSSIKEKHVLDGFFHDTLGEKERKAVFDKMRAFISSLYAQAPRKHDYSEEDRWSPFADEYRALQTPLSRFSPKGVFYRCVRKAFSTLGRLSDGLKLGDDAGFNSGAMLDYVYQNVPSGRAGIGKLFDWFYLKTPGWAGIRQRKTNLETMIKKAAEDLQTRHMPVRILDAAAGHGRYILDALKDGPGFDGALLRDYDPENVKKGRELIQKLGLQDKVKFEQGDAFDADNVAAVSPRPTLAVVSGFYEIFPDNANVRKSLEGLSRAVEPGGLLVYTAQPWHPQLELIARTLRDLSSPDKLWVMRARSQGEMDALVAQAGFVKQTQIIDEQGMFSVSIAQKS